MNDNPPVGGKMTIRQLANKIIFQFKNSEILLSFVTYHLKFSSVF